MKNFNLLSKMCSPLVGSQSNDVSFDCRLTVGSPSGLDAKWKLKLVSVLVLILTVGVGQMWGADELYQTITFLDNGTDGDGSSSFNSSTDITDKISPSDCATLTTTTSYVYQAQEDYGWKLSSSGSNGTVTLVLKSKIKNVTKIVINASRYHSTKGTNLNCNSLGAQALSYDWDDFTYTYAKATDITQIVLAASAASSGDRRCYVRTLKIYCEAAASCEANPTIGDASLNGSFNMTSTTSAIGVASGTCSTGNAACDWTDYGFVWSDGANTTTPTVGGTNCNKVKVGESGTGTSWTGSITPSGSTTPTSWTTGHTYYVRTYGKNSKAGAAFVEGSTWSFTPYMVTFNKNDGGATTSTQYVQGGVSTLLTSNSFSRTGYTFNGWNTDADGTSGTGYTNGQSVSLSANLTLYAKWSAKQCTISFDIEGGTGTITNVTATYGQAMPSKESNLPTKTGYNFGGFWDGDGGTGTQYYNADGTSKINWNKDVTAAQTLYAKWTVKSFTVTWMVNGEAYTPSGSGGTDGSSSVNFGSHVTTLPTAPTPPCGNKFMGWTTTNIGSVGLDKDDDAAAITALNLFSTTGDAPVISAEGNVTYYAVFADYAE